MLSITYGESLYLGPPNGQLRRAKKLSFERAHRHDLHGRAIISRYFVDGRKNFAESPLRAAVAKRGRPTRWCAPRLSSGYKSFGGRGTLFLAVRYGRSPSRRKTTPSRHAASISAIESTADSIGAGIRSPMCPLRHPAV